MRIVHCLTRSEHGGGQQVTYSLVQSLLRWFSDVSVAVVLPPGGIYLERFQQLRVETVALPLNRLSPSVAFRTFSTLKKLRPDIVHSHGKGAGLYVRLVAAMLPRARFIHSYHGFHPPAGRLRHELYLQIERMILRWTDRIVSVSTSECMEITAALPASQGKIALIRNSIDIGKIVEEAEHPLPEPLASFLSQANGHFVVTMIGRDDPVKNYPLALRTAQSVLSRNNRIVFVFVGLDVAKARANGLQEKFSKRMFVLPALNETSALLRRSDALLLTSTKEGCPLVVLESFALGKPVIGTNVPGIRDLIVDGKNGLLCDQTSDAVAQAIERLASDRQMYRTIAAGALRAGEQMDLEGWARAYYKLYREVCG